MSNDDRWKGSRYGSPENYEAAIKVFNTKISVTYLDPGYELEIPKENLISDEGLLQVGEIKPIVDDLPRFIMRWDEKDNHLNVDIYPPEKDWKQEKNGYQGHTPKKSDISGRSFELEIEIPERKIIDAVISFNLARDVHAKASIGVSAKASFEKKKRD